MKLRSRKSEYQQSFAKPSDDFFKTVYQDQYTYRCKRRERENQHFKFKWESESSDSQSENDNASQDQDCNDNTKIVLPSIEDPTQPEGAARLNAAEDNYKITDDEQKSTNKDDGKDETLTEGRKSRVKSRSSTRCKSRERSSSAKPPFVSYGWADKQLETGRKKTHNVQAPRKSVHVGALKRQSYMEKLKEKKQRCASRASSVLSSLPILQKKPSDSSCWQTEYQRCYSSQSDRPKTSSSTKSIRKSKASTRRPNRV
uniref:Uncharacterized protein n=1 Tax=Ciona savignyi TaxID=51511 RepID=H2ZD90_CIOSA